MICVEPPLATEDLWTAIPGSTATQNSSWYQDVPESVGEIHYCSIANLVRRQRLFAWALGEKPMRPNVNYSANTEK